MPIRFSGYPFISILPLMRTANNTEPAMLRSQLYADTRLLMDECSLTTSLRLADLTGKEIDTLHFQYAMGRVPGLLWEAS
jgi:hypothetical protein